MEIFKTALQYSSWPLVVLVALFLFRSALQKALTNIRGLKAGSLELLFHKQLERQGFTKEELAVIRTLTAEETDHFLLVSYSDDARFNYRVGHMSAHEHKRILLKLREAGLLSVINPEDSGDNIRHTTTSLGKQVRAMIVNSTLQLLRGDS